MLPSGTSAVGVTRRHLRIDADEVAKRSFHTLRELGEEAVAPA